MLKNQGFISVISLLIMSIILISALSLSYISNLEYLILNSSKNNIQAFYAAESKIYMVLNKEKPYYDQLLSRIERYIKLGRSGKPYDYEIIIDDEDLIEGDRIDKVKLRFFIENNRKILELESSSSYGKIAKKLIAKITILNDFFEKGLPIVSENSISCDRIEEYTAYMDKIQREIKLPDQYNDIIGIDASNYDSIKIIKDLDGRTNIEFFRNNIENPIRKQILSDEYVFLIAKKNNLNPITVSVLSENDSDEVDLKGVFYIEGNFEIHSNSVINGILIINKGSLIVKPSMEFKVEGIVLLKDYIGEEIENNDNIKINYNGKLMEKCGIYLPGFIKLKIQVIKSS